MFVALVATVWLHLGVPLIAALFTYLALEKLHLLKRWGKWFPVLIFVILVLGFAYGLGYVIRQAVHALPEIADKAIPSLIQLARQYHVELPFTDYDSLKDVALDTVKIETAHFAGVAKFARGASSGFLLLLLGVVTAIGLFINPDFERLGKCARPSANLYSETSAAIATRFHKLYSCFTIVMGAQVVISALNTVLTAVFVLLMHLPYGLVVIGVTFLCGLLPIIGNLISNSIIIGIAITVSPRTALIALAFLIVVHKLEYFLNSKIVGQRIRNPFWLTLLALLIGERIMGIPGMVLASVILSYIKAESSDIPVRNGSGSAPALISA